MITYKELKSIAIRFSGRSSDYIFPTVIQGCVGGCHYCYAARHNPDSFYEEQKISNNLDKILEKVKHFEPDIIKPNQTHDKYITWDIGCNSDITPLLKYFDWYKLFDYFKHSERDFGTFATKFTNKDLLSYNPDRKIRVRMSLMPEHYSKVIEPKTTLIRKRIEFINHLYEAGYEVHINFSPVIYTNTWLKDYEQLFELIDSTLTDDVKQQLKCEVIFLTHNANLHLYNLEKNKKGEQVLWCPQYQEDKISKFGGNNIRYKHQLKSKLIDEFKQLLSNIPYCEIRYIF